MKKLFFLGVLALVGCTNNPQPGEQPSHTADRDSYPQEHQLKTGRQTPAEALSQEDPSVSVSGR